MSVDALKIIEQQLQYLANRSDKGLLTEAETVQLANLVKIRILVKAKTSDGDDDPLSEMSAEQLKSLLELSK